jgi:hypothetical protein
MGFSPWDMVSISEYSLIHATQPLKPHPVTNPQYPRPNPHTPNYFSRFYSAKSLVKPPNPPKTT